MVQSNDNSSPFYHCTSAGIYQGYDKDTCLHKIALRNPVLELPHGEKRFQMFFLEEFQFMIWYSCHGSIIAEQEMFEKASILWEQNMAEKKKGVLKCYNELKEMGLIYMSQSVTIEEGVYDVFVKVQPYVVNIFDYGRLVKSPKLLFSFSIWRKTILSLFLDPEEKKMIHYLRENPGANFLEYLSNSQKLASGEYARFGCMVNSLMSKGFILPVGWCSSLLSTK